MKERELTTLQKEAENYIGRAISIPNPNGFGFKSYTFVSLDDYKNDHGILKQFGTDINRAYPLSKLIELYKNTDKAVNDARDQANKL